MGRPPALALVWLVAAAHLAVAADDNDRPIPQDPARIKKFSDDWLAWNRATLGDAYDKVGKHDPKWDKSARNSLDLAARMFSLRDDPWVTAADVYPVARKAVDAGCADPLVLYVYAQTSRGANDPGEPERIARLRRAAEALAASDYSPYRRAVAALRVAQMRLQYRSAVAAKDDDRAIGEDLDRIFARFAESVTRDPRGFHWDMMWDDVLFDVFRLMNRMEGDSKQAFDRFNARLAKVPGVEALRLSLKGHFLMTWAWEARSDRIAALVNQDQFAEFRQRLEEAQRTLEEAYKLNPNQPAVARTMLEVHKGLGSDDDRATMELWFDRAMTLQPFDKDSCWNKLDWLDPKWHGDPEGKAMLAFGRACAATENWRTGIILLGADAIHRQYAHNPQAEGGKYLGRDDNWALIESVNEEYLKHYPDDAAALTKYAFMSFWAGRPGKSHDLFQRVGDRLTRWTDTPNVAIEQIRRVRDRAAKLVAEKKTEGSYRPAKP